MQPRAGIAEDIAAYRRGVVLGLTMAEIMLLLVFCLLIATAVVLTRNKDDNVDLRQEIARLEAQTASLTKERNTLQEVIERIRQSAPASSTITDDWKKLSTDQKFAEAVDAAGLPREDILKQAADLKVLLKPLAEGVMAEDLISASREIERFETIAAASGVKDLALEDLVRLAKAALERETGGKGEHDWPPIIPLSEAEGYSFAVGRAELTADFERRKSALVDQVATLIAQYRVDVIEVVGHTDEQRMAPKPSNLDSNLIGAMTGSVPIASLTPGDNAGLGMARAVSVASVLRADTRLKGIKIIPFSAAQLVLPGDRLSDGSATGDVKERRRIEIRMRRSAGPATR